MTYIYRQTMLFFILISFFVFNSGPDLSNDNRTLGTSPGSGPLNRGGIEMNPNYQQTGTLNVDITINPDIVVGVSSFSPGLTHTDHSLRWGDSTAIANVKDLLLNGLVYQNTYIMAWGPPDPWPDPASPEPTNWAYLDHRLSVMKETGAIPVITLMNAPWWMKGELQKDGTTKLIPDANGEWASYKYGGRITDFRGLTYPKGYVSPDPYSARILDNQMANWLLLVRRIAERYMVSPYHVRYFQVWNELKGYYDPALNRWDYENQAGDPSGYYAKHGYTYMYNQVYQVLRDVASSNGIDPDSVLIGGPYVSVKTWTSTSAGGFPSQEPLLQNKPYGTFDQRDLDVIKYWLQNKAGAGFITIDGSNRNREGTALTDPYTANEKFSDVTSWLRSLDNSAYPSAQTLPIFYAEWYASPYDTVDRSYNNSVKADGVIKFLKAGGDVVLTWGGVENTTNTMLNPSMYTNTDVTGGGQALPWYYSYKAFRDYFGPGTRLLETSQTSSDIAVLASTAKTMLVNKTNLDLTVSVNGVLYSLTPYEVRIVDTPLQGTSTPTSTPTPDTTVTPTVTDTLTPTPSSTSTDTPTPTSTPTSSDTPTVTPPPIPDDIPPTVTIQSPPNGSVVNRGSTLTITADASDNIGVDRVEFLVAWKGGSFSCQDSTAAYSCDWAVPGKPSTAYTITATAYDAQGNFSSAKISVTSSK